MTASPRRSAAFVFAFFLLGVAAVAFGRQRCAHPGESSTDVLPRDTTVQRVLMSTIWKVVLPAGTRRDATVAAERALDEVSRLEGVLSEWRPGTEISRVNAAAGGAPVPVGPDTWTLVARSLDYARLSDGAFDPTWAALRGLWDFRATDPRPPTPEAVRALLPLVNWRAVEMNAHAHTIRLEKPGMALGLGGIAKGYALDRARVILLDAGVRNFVLYSGGQVLVEGTHGGRSWRVGVQHPRNPRALLGTLSITAGSVSTGGDYEHYFVYEGRRYHHIIDPQTGYPVEHTIAVTVCARTGLEADALDTVLFVMSPPRAMALAQSLGVAMIRTGPDLQSEVSPAMRAMIELRTPLDPFAPTPTGAP